MPESPKDPVAMLRSVVTCARCVADHGTKKAEKQLEHSAKEALSAMLGRKPTPEEIDAVVYQI